MIGLPDTQTRVPLAPSPASLAKIRSRTRWAAPLGRLLMKPWLQGAEVRGVEHLHGEPVLLLMNHGCPIDPMIFGCFTGIPVQWLVTTTALQRRYGRSRWLAAFGQVPTRKLEAETRAMRTLAQWSAAGAHVGVFPEGMFSWDGRPQPLQPGLSQLVRFLDRPVVTARVENGDRFWPTWSGPRVGRVRFTLDPPRRFEAGEDIQAAVQAAIRVDPADCWRAPVRSSTSARGSARLLGRCPECGGSGLSDHGNQLSCTCGAVWTVTTENRLEGTSSLSISEALQHVQEHMPAVLVSQGEVEVRTLTGPTEEVVTAGILTLQERTLTVGTWTLALDEVLATTRDWPHRILLRTRRNRIGLDLPHDSRALWSHALGGR